MGAVVSGALSFGADPGTNEAEATIAAAGCAASSKAEAFVQVDSTADNTTDDHKTLAALGRFVCEPQTDQVVVTCKVEGGFYAQGDFDINVVWS